MRRTLAALFACSTLLAACGGEDGLTAEQYRERAAAICRGAERDVERLGRPAGASADAVAEYFRRALEVAERRVAEQRRLEAPEDLRDEQRRIVEIQERGVGVVRDLVRRLERDEDPRQVLTGVQDELQQLERQSDRLARRLDIDACVTD